MIYKSLLIAASLSPTLAAGGMRRVQESTSLGDLFLAAAKNVTDTTMIQYQKDSYISAEVKGEAMASLRDDMHEVCIQLGVIESESQNGDGQSGEVQSYSATCRFNTIEDFDTASQVMRDAIMAANPATTSFQASTNNYYNDIAGQKAQQRGLEMLLHLAETLEEVMLIVPYWQNVLSSGHYPQTSSISVNLNKVYEYTDGMTDDMAYLEESGESGELTETAVSRNPDGI